MIGLGKWDISVQAGKSLRLKTRRKTRSSQGKSVADPYDRTTLESFARSKDPAMVNAVETPSASRTTGDSGFMQRTEAGSHQRNDVPVKKGKACDTLKDSGLSDAGDSSREKGGTQEFLTVHSQL